MTTRYQPAAGPRTPQPPQGGTAVRTVNSGATKEGPMCNRKHPTPPTPPPPSPMTAERLSELERIAKAATPGPWRHYPTGSYVHASSVKVCQLEDPWIANRNQANDAAHIAAFSPETALVLLAEIAALRRPVLETTDELHLFACLLEDASE